MNGQLPRAARSESTGPISNTDPASNTLVHFPSFFPDSPRFIGESDYESNYASEQNLNSGRLVQDQDCHLRSSWHSQLRRTVNEVALAFELHDITCTTVHFVRNLAALPSTDLRELEKARRAIATIADESDPEDEPSVDPVPAGRGGQPRHYTYIRDQSWAYSTADNVIEFMTVLARRGIGFKLRLFFMMLRMFHRSRSNPRRSHVVNQYLDDVADLLQRRVAVSVANGIALCGEDQEDGYHYDHD